ncbi:MAG: MBL fold metallo-hydrolase [Vicinamibacterales bacterium]
MRTPRPQRAVALAALALALTVFVSAAPRAPAFELHALGVLGGDTDTNLTCFLLGRPGSGDLVMIDAGSIMPGLTRWLENDHVLAADATPSARARAALDVFGRLRGVFLTHAHLDHWGGLADDSTLFVALAQQGHPPMPIYGLPETLDTLRDHLFRSQLWADFTAIPARNPALTLRPIGDVDAGGFHVHAIRVNHAIPGAAFLIRSGDAAYLHFGDTGATQAAWAAARPLLASKELRAISLEMSFPASQEALAETSGHLTRSSFLLELAKLAGVTTSVDPRQMTDADAVALAAKLAPSFRDCPVFVIHVKALGYDQVKKEVEALQKAGLNLILPTQGETYRF